MVQQYRYIMALMDVLAHPCGLRSKGRGINSSEMTVNTTICCYLGCLSWDFACVDA